MTSPSTGHQVHQALLEQLEAVSQWWPDPSQVAVSAMNAREVLVHLTELRDTLKNHFAAEEDRGLLPESTTIDPQWTKKADHLLSQHGPLLERLNSVIATVPITNENPSAWSIAKGHFDEFRKELGRHETAEIELIQSACGESLGVGD